MKHAILLLALACSNTYAYDHATCAKQSYWVQMAVDEHQKGHSFNWMYDTALESVDKAWLDAMLKKVFRDDSARMLLANPVAVGNAYLVDCSPDLKELRAARQKQRDDLDHPRWEK